MRIDERPPCSTRHASELTARAVAVHVSPEQASAIGRAARTAGVRPEAVEALLRVECAARPADLRAVELVAFVLLTLFGARRAALRMTLGPYQVRVERVVAEDASLLEVLSAGCRLMRWQVGLAAAVRIFLDQGEPVESVEQMCRVYNGPLSGHTYVSAVMLTCRALRTSRHKLISENAA